MKAQTSNNDIVILVHGLLRTTRSLSRLGKYLIAHGYDVHLYGYNSVKHKIKTHGSELKKYIENILAQNENKKIHFVTHSLGGIITREALSLLSLDQINRCGRFIMLAPPNQGSPYAKRVIKWLPFLPKIIKPLRELSSEQGAYVHKVFIPQTVPFGIVVGKFDTTTPPEYTHLRGQSDFTIIDCAHTFIMNHPEARSAITQFLQTASFKN